MQDRALKASDLPQVKLFTPTVSRGLTPEMTLPEFYRQFYLPVVLEARGSASRNVDQYEQSLSLWQRLTGDPPLSQIDEITIAEFTKALWKLPGKKLGSKISANTVHKHCRTLQAILDRTGPKSRENRQGRNLISDVPYFEKPKIERRQQFDRNLSFPEIAAWLRVAGHAEAPEFEGRPAGVWWQSLIIFDYNTGPRIGTLLELLWDWKYVDEHGTWFRVPAGGAPKIKTELLIYCNAAACGALKRIQPAKIAPGDHVFPMPFGESWLHHLRRQQFVSAGIFDRYDEGFHLLRRTCATEASVINSDLAKIVLGHSGDVTLDHYLQRARLCGELEKMPQPPWQPPDTECQRFLFQ
jgi:integrase